MKILIIEDETALATDIVAYLSSEHMVCTVANDLASAQEALLLYAYDLVLLDVGLPDGNGLELISLIQQQESVPGILILSARNALDDRLKGLDLGADDYLIKPFYLAELLSRLRALYRRKHFSGKTRIRFGELEIFPDAYQISIRGQQVHLSPKEFQLLLYLASNPDKVLPRPAIAEHLWGDDADKLDDFDFIYSQVKNLRRKMVQHGGKDRIKAIYGVGYKFDGA